MPWSLSLILQLYQPLERNVGQVFLAANTANITIGAGLPSMVPGMDETLLKTNFALDKAHKDNDPSSPRIQLIVWIQLLAGSKALPADSEPVPASSEILPAGSDAFPLSFETVIPTGPLPNHFPTNIDSVIMKLVSQRELLTMYNAFATILS